MSVSFGEGATRQVQPGDTPDLNDGLLSRPVNTTISILRGQACEISGNGFVSIATTTGAENGRPPFVPIESVDNSAGTEPVPISGVSPNQRVAVTIKFTSDSQTIFPGNYLKVENGTGNLVIWDNTTDDGFDKFCRFIGIEAALLDTNASTPFDETLTVGVVPDQSVSGDTGETFVGWVQLMENPGNS